MTLSAFETPPASLSTLGYDFSRFLPPHWDAVRKGTHTTKLPITRGPRRTEAKRVF